METVAIGDRLAPSHDVPCRNSGKDVVQVGLHKKNFIQIAKTLLILGKQNVLQRELFQYALLRNGEGITFDFEVCWMIVIILKRIQFDCSH